MVEHVDVKWLQMARQSQRLCPESISEMHETLSPFLKCTMSPDFHRDHLILMKGEMLGPRNLVWMMPALSALMETDHSKSGEDKQKNSIWHFDTAVPLIILECS